MATQRSPDPKPQTLPPLRTAEETRRDEGRRETRRGDEESRAVAADQSTKDPQEVIEHDDLQDPELHRVTAVAGVSRLALEDGEEWPGRPHTPPEGHTQGEPGPGEPGGPTAGHYPMPGESGGELVEAEEGNRRPRR